MDTGCDLNLEGWVDFWKRGKACEVGITVEGKVTASGKSVCCEDQPGKNWGWGRVAFHC